MARWRAGPAAALALAAPMPAPLFHRKGGDGVQELKLYIDVSGKSTFILKVGSGKAEHFGNDDRIITVLAFRRIAR